MLELPSADESILIAEYARVSFLDEFRMLVMTSDPPDVPEFTLIDTLVLAGHSANSRRFRLPQRYRDLRPIIHVDGDRCLGTLDRDRPLITDPTQAVLVIELEGDEQQVLVIVRIQTLVGHLRSVGADGCVPWDEWKGGAVVMKVPRHGSGGSCSSPLVQGVRVILQKVDNPIRYPGRFHLSTFDFSRRGFSILPYLDEGDGAERKASFKDAQDFLIQGYDKTADSMIDSLGDNNFIQTVSSFLRWKMVTWLMVR